MSILQSSHLRHTSTNLSIQTCPTFTVSAIGMNRLFLRSTAAKAVSFNSFTLHVAYSQRANKSKIPPNFAWSWTEKTHRNIIDWKHIWPWRGQCSLWLKPNKKKTFHCLSLATLVFYQKIKWLTKRKRQQAVQLLVCKRQNLKISHSFFRNQQIL